MPHYTVEMIQRELMDEGYDIGPDGVDGDGGPNTMRALGQFQLNHRLPVTGNADLETLKALFPDDFKTRTTPMNNVIGSLFDGLLGNLLRSETIKSWLRSALLAAGGGLVASGKLSLSDLNTVVGGIMVVVSLLFSTLSANTKQKAMDVVKAADAAPDVIVVPASATSDKKPIVTANKNVS